MANSRGAAWLVLFLLALTAETAYCFLHPIAYFDTIAYVSLANGAEYANDFAIVGNRCPQVLPGDYSGCAEVLSSSVFREASALSASSYARFLRFYTVKPLYNGVVRGVSRMAGVDAFRALRLVSAASFAAIGLIVVFWLRSMVPPAIASCAALCLVSLPGTIGLGRGLLPDALLTALLLLGAGCLALRKPWWTGAAFLLLATLVRPDALLFAAVYGAVLLWQIRVTWARWLGLLLLAVLAAGWTLLLGYLTGALPWRVLFIHSFLAWTPPADYLSLHISLREYLHVMGSNGVRTVLFCLPLPGLLAVLALGGRRVWTPMRQVVLAGVIAVLLRVLLYPGVEDRYYVWLSLLAGVGAISSLVERQTGTENR